MNDPYQWATALCARSEQCRADVAEKLRRRGIDAHEAESLLDRLEDEGYISEERYVRAFVHDRFLFDRWGRLKIRQALLMRRLPSALVSEVMDDVIPEDDYRQQLQDFLHRKLQSLNEPDSIRLTQKLMRSAASRGYEPEEVFRALDSLKASLEPQ